MSALSFFIGTYNTVRPDFNTPSIPGISETD